MGPVIYCFLASLFIIGPIIKVWFPDQTFSIPYFYGCTGMLLYGLQLYHNSQWKLSLTDLLLLALFLYNLSDILKYNYFPIVMSMFVTYLLSKTLSNRSKITYILIGSGILQVLIMSIQWSGILVTNRTFTIIGSFDNPGPLGGYLGICYIACIGNYRHMNKYVYIVCNFILGGALIFSNSRAAWLGVTLALLYMGMKSLNINRIRQIIIFTVFITAFITLSLTTYKTDSAKGRLAIWKISIEMMTKDPLLGNGLASFRRDYMKHQAYYQNEHPNIDKNKFLTNNGFAFNEYLHILYEQGIVGLSLILTILILLIREGVRQNSPFLLCLIVLAIFSCFSYPLEVFPLLILTSMITGILSTNRYIITLKKDTLLRKWVISTLCVSLIIIMGYRWMENLRLENALHSFLYRNDYKSLDYLSHHHPTIKNNTDFLLRYARILYMKGEYKIAIPIMKQAILLYPTTDKYCELGDIYQSLEQYENAEQAYRHAIYLLPTRIYSHYCLFCLYKNTDQKEKAIDKAYDIIKLSPKKKSQHYIEIISQVKQYIIDL